MLLPGRNKVPGQIKQSGGLDSALGPCVCNLFSRAFCSLLELARQNLALNFDMNLGMRKPKVRETQKLAQYSVPISS